MTKYSQEDLDAAIAAYKEHDLSLRQVQQLYGKSRKKRKVDRNKKEKIGTKTREEKRDKPKKIQEKGCKLIF